MIGKEKKKEKQQQRERSISEWFFTLEGRKGDTGDGYSEFLMGL